MNENLEEILVERRKTMLENQRQFTEVKKVCAEYFERYDVTIEETMMRTKHMEEKYENWSKTLVEPTALNVARLYALENALNQEEAARMQESRFMKEILAKLVFSIDELNTQKLGSQKKVNGSDFKTNYLDNLELADIVKFPKLQQNNPRSKNSQTQTNIDDRHSAERPSSA